MCSQVVQRVFPLPLLCDYYVITMILLCDSKYFIIETYDLMIKTEKGLHYFWKGFLRIVTF